MCLKNCSTDQEIIHVVRQVYGVYYELYCRIVLTGDVRNVGIDERPHHNDHEDARPNNSRPTLSSERLSKEGGKAILQPSTETTSSNLHHATGSCKRTPLCHPLHPFTMVKPPRTMQPESVDLAQMGRAKRRAPFAGENTFAHYMARKIDLQRQQFGCVVPPPPPPPLPEQPSRPPDDTACTPSMDNTSPEQDHPPRCRPRILENHCRPSSTSTAASSSRRVTFAPEAHALPSPPYASTAAVELDATCNTTPLPPTPQARRRKKKRPHPSPLQTTTATTTTGLTAVLRRLKRRHGEGGGGGEGGNNSPVVTTSSTDTTGNGAEELVSTMATITAAVAAAVELPVRKEDPASATEPTSSRADGKEGSDKKLAFQQKEETWQQPRQLQHLLENCENLELTSPAGPLSWEPSQLQSRARTTTTVAGGSANVRSGNLAPVPSHSSSSESMPVHSKKSPSAPRKRSLLQIQRPDLFFHGVVVLVNGHTEPDPEWLQRCLHKHGGDVEKYETTRVTHVVATVLSDAKARFYQNRTRSYVPVVRPEWIVDSVKAGQLLPHQDYLLDQLKEKGGSGRTQPQISTFLRPSTVSPKQPSASKSVASSHALASDPEAPSDPLFTKETKEWIDLNGTEADENEEACEVEVVDVTEQHAASLKVAHASPTDAEDAVPPTREDSDANLGSSSAQRPSNITERPIDGTMDNSSALGPVDRRPAAAACATDTATSVNENPPRESSRRGVPPEERGIGTYHQAFVQPSAVPMEVDLHDTSSRECVLNDASIGPTLHNERRTDDQYIAGRVRTVGTDPNFLKTFFQASRLSFIGSYKQRTRHSPSKVASSHLRGPADQRTKRFVFHVDMDSFFASVVLRNFPQYRDKPVAISHNGNPTRTSSRSGTTTTTPAGSTAATVASTSECATCNYRARAFGVKKGMFLGRAKELCPDLIVLPYDFEGYEEVSEQVADILTRYASNFDGCVEQVSCDESYVEMNLPLPVKSGTTVGVDDLAENLAASMRTEIVQATDCTASIGIASNKLLAKVGLSILC